MKMCLSNQSFDHLNNKRTESIHTYICSARYVDMYVLMYICMYTYIHVCMYIETRVPRIFEEI